MPRNSEVQGRLVRATTEIADSVGLSLDPSAQDYLGTLIGEAVERIETEQALDSPEDLDRAEKAFGTLMRKTAADGLKGTMERRGRVDAAEAPQLVSEASLQSALAGLCPIWPIC